MKKPPETLAKFDKQLFVGHKLFNRVISVCDLLFVCARLQKTGSKETTTLGSPSAVQGSKQGGTLELCGTDILKEFQGCDGDTIECHGLGRLAVSNSHRVVAEGEVELLSDVGHGLGTSVFIKMQEIEDIPRRMHKKHKSCCRDMPSEP